MFLLLISQTCRACCLLFTTVLHCPNQEESVRDSRIRCASKLVLPLLTLLGPRCSRIVCECTDTCSRTPSPTSHGVDCSTGSSSSVCGWWAMGASGIDHRTKIPPGQSNHSGYGRDTTPTTPPPPSPATRGGSPC